MFLNKQCLATGQFFQSSIFNCSNLFKKPEQVTQGYGTVNFLLCYSQATSVVKLAIVKEPSIYQN